jgi:hypothetical protein
MSDALDRLEGSLVEICPDCEGWADCCVTCMDTGLVPHVCRPDGAED